MKHIEQSITQLVARYLTLQYPQIIRQFTNADVKFTVGQAVKLKRLYENPKSYPDLFIAATRGKYSGLYIEIKKDHNEAYRKDGTLRQNKHIQGQNDMLNRLSAEGYKCSFGCGFDEIKQQIDDYLRAA